MADFRTVHCKLWDKEWFVKESSDGKALYMLLFTGPRTSAAGIYEIPKWDILARLGIAEAQLDELLNRFTRDDRLMYCDGVMWVKKMREYQGSLSPKLQKRIDGDFKMVKDGPVKQAYAEYYGYITPQLPKSEPDEEHEPDIVSSFDEYPSDTVSDTVSQPDGYGIDDTPTPDPLTHGHMTHDTPTPRAVGPPPKRNLLQRLDKLLPRMVSATDSQWLNDKIEDFGDDMVEKAIRVAEERTSKPDNPLRFITTTLENMRKGQKPPTAHSGGRPVVRNLAI
jgi:hypothetical protein